MNETSLIGDHGAIGDLETLALVDGRAAIDWLCWPRFDSPSVFGRLLDESGGHWSISPTGGDVTVRQLYLPETNVLITRFHHPEGIAELEDSMLIGIGVRAVVRRVRGIRGSLSFRSECRPRPDYGRHDPDIEIVSDRQASISIGDGDMLGLLASVGIDIEDEDEDEDEAIVSEFEIDPGSEVTFVLTPTPDRIDLDHDYTGDTAAYWRDWVGRSNYRGRWREIVHRSALTLKLLTHAPSGAMIAAGTTSLPEVIGGERNWDYRFVWIRDAAFTLYALLRLGFDDEADAFAHWLEERIADCGDADGPPLAPLYDLDGRSDIDEVELDHWSGFAGSRPVRVGNAAASQFQLDIYGEIIDSLYLADKYGDGLSSVHWSNVCVLVDWVCEHWDEPDEGMWEVRNGRQRFTSSALMCWVAIERAMRMASRRGRPAPVEQWRRTRDEIHDAIHDHGWSDEQQAFTQRFDGTALDASILLMPMMKFISPTDPKWISTLNAIGDSLVHDALVDRYDLGEAEDGVDGGEGSFTICSFWYVEALARSGRVGEARVLFDKLLTYASPLGLFSEEIGITGRQLGNFPQAFSHLALISAATYLDEALDEQ